MASHPPESPTFVIDLGSDTVKAGIGSEDAVSLIVPSYEGQCECSEEKREIRSKGFSKMDKYGQPIYIQRRPKELQKEASLKYPIEHGVITSWDDIENLLNFVIGSRTENDESASNVNDSMLLALSPSLFYGAKINKEKMAKIMFESMKMDRVCFACTSTLSLYAIGKTNGMVVDLGKARSYTVPVVDGYIVPHALVPLSVSGGDLTAYLMELINEKGQKLTTFWEREVVKEIKEKYVDIPTEDTLDFTGIKKKKYKLPDGNTIVLDGMQQRCAEALFQPHLVGNEWGGIPQLVYESIQQCDIELRRSLYSNILACGGSTLFSNFAGRLQKEMVTLTPAAVKSTVKVIAPPERRYIGWIGGSVLTSLSEFGDMCLSKEEYEEKGPGIANRCL